MIKYNVHEGVIVVHDITVLLFVKYNTIQRREVPGRRSTLLQEWEGLQPMSH